jgi:hypothetical protein
MKKTNLVVILAITLNCAGSCFAADNSNDMINPSPINYGAVSYPPIDEMQCPLPPIDTPMVLQEGITVTTPGGISNITASDYDQFTFID